MSIENILKRIDGETEEAIGAIRGKTEERLAAIREDYEKKGARLREELERAVRAKAADEERRLIVGEELELRKASLLRKREILGEVYGEARKRIEGLPPDSYLELLRSLIVRHSLSGKEEIVVPAAQRELFTAEFVASLNRLKGTGASFTLAGTGGDFAWGVILREGQRKVDLTLDVVFDQLVGRVEPQVAGTLFPE
jgi:vacuolar-type H+-ATPase subunit E/Vma4